MTGAATPCLVCGPDTLRRAGAADANAFERLQHAAYAPNRPLLGVEPVPLLTPAETVLATYEVWLLDQGGGLAGALCLLPRHDDLEIWSVAVDPARQNDGIGRRLLAAAEARARELGQDTIRLFTGARLTKNIDWYGRRGYAVERTEERPDRRLVHMKKTLGT